MKKLSILFILVSLILLIPVYSFGAIQNYGDGFAETDNWYTITPDKPYIETHFRYIGYPAPGILIGAEYFQSDQTFFDFNTYVQGDYNEIALYGSYLTSFGLFAGFDLYSSNSSLSLIISPGYRLSIDEQSYVAASLDYLFSEYRKEIIDFEVNARYYNDNMKVFGDMTYFTEPVSMILELGSNYQIAEPVVIGGGLYVNKTTKNIGIGGTYNSDMFIIDGEFIFYIPTNADISNQIYLNGMFLLGDIFKVGAQFTKKSTLEYPALTLKAKMTMENSSFTFKFTPKNDSYYSLMSLAYELQL